MIKISQLRAARAILGWSQEDLSSRSGVSKPTIARLELGADGDIGGYQGTRDKLTTALEIAGVIFVDENGEGPGVRLRKSKQAAASTIATTASPEETEMEAEKDKMGTNPKRERKSRVADKIAKETEALNGKLAATKLGPRPAKQHPKPVGPATDAVKRMAKDIAADKRKAKTIKPNER